MTDINTKISQLRDTKSKLDKEIRYLRGQFESLSNQIKMLSQNQIDVTDKRNQLNSIRNEIRTKNEELGRINKELRTKESQVPRLQPKPVPIHQEPINLTSQPSLKDLITLFNSKPTKEIASQLETMRNDKIQQLNNLEGDTRPESKNNIITLNNEISLINQTINPKQKGGSSYKEKYLKYKNKYLKLKNHGLR